MRTFMLIHGAGDSTWYWHLVEPELRKRGHDVAAMDLPCDDDSAGLAEYADTVVDALGHRRHLVLVAQSCGGFIAPLVCERVPVDLMVLVAGMIPSPGEAPNDYWTNTGYKSPELDQVEITEGMSEEDAWTMAAFMHDVPPEIAAVALKRVRKQCETPGASLGQWMHGPTYQQGSCSAGMTGSSRRNGYEGREGPPWNHSRRDRWRGHCVALSGPRELADRLDSYTL